MDMMSVMWQFGVLAAVIIFGIKIGLASGLANLSKKLFACICVGYGGLVDVLPELYYLGTDTE